MNLIALALVPLGILVLLLLSQAWLLLRLRALTVVVSEVLAAEPVTSREPIADDTIGDRLAA